VLLLNKVRFWVMSKSIIKKEEFQLSNYVKNGLHETKKSTFIFKQAEIDKLPLIRDGIVDLYDHLESKPGFSFILRINQTSKTFYIKTKKSKSVSFNSMRKIGKFSPRKNGVRPPKEFIELSAARNIFEQKVEELSTLSAEALTVSEMTIREYIETMYSEDRAVTLLKNGKCKPVTDKTKKEIISLFPHWIDKKINEATNQWPKDFKKYWLSNKHLDEETKKEICTTTTETMRKKYGMLNAVFNMCENKGYILKNPLEGQTALFPKSKNRSRIEYDYSFEEAIDFIFSDEVEARLAGKLIIATMILTGARNAEVYKNYRKNFDEVTGVIFIPAHISKNQSERSVMIQNKTYWEYFNLYVKLEYSKNKHGHMFPSIKIDSHVSPEVYRKVWVALKLRFGLAGRLYDTRHTFAKRYNKENGISATADVIGDSVQTAHEFYVRGDENKKFANMASLQNKNKKTEIRSTDELEISNTQKIITVNVDILPEPLKALFIAFQNGKITPSQNQLFLEQWLKFVSFVSKKHERSDLGEEVDDWLLMQQ